MRHLYVGTSGWQYSNWQGLFYPNDLPTNKWLSFYSKSFSTVEVNSSFYRQPKATTFQKWQRETPPNFVFALKGNRFITHIKRLNQCSEPAKVFFENVSVLTGSHVILWQLPPSLKQDLERLGGFLKLLPTTFRHAFEFRHPTWVSDKTWQILKKFNCAVVFQDWHEWPIIKEQIADFIYLRFHGNRVLYTSNYTANELKSWADKIKSWLKASKDVYAYFNNDAAGFAVPNALKLKELVE